MLITTLFTSLRVPAKPARSNPNPNEYPMNIDKQKAEAILSALVYKDIIDEAIEDYRGDEVPPENPLIKEFAGFCGLSDDELEDLHEDVLENLEEYANYTFWDDFAEKVARIKREEEEQEKDLKLSREEALIVLFRYMDEINDILDETDQIDIWKYIAKYFKTNPIVERNG